MHASTRWAVPGGLHCHGRRGPVPRKLPYVGLSLHPHLSQEEQQRRRPCCIVLLLLWSLLLRVGVMVVVVVVCILHQPVFKFTRVVNSFSQQLYLCVV